MAQQTGECQETYLHESKPARLVAAGVERVDFFSDELITAQTSDGRMHIKGEGLYIENLNAGNGRAARQGPGHRPVVRRRREARERAGQDLFE